MRAVHNASTAASCAQRGPSTPSQRGVDDLCAMPWRLLSFSHLWIAFGAFSTTVLSWLWVGEGRALADGGLAAAVWVGASTGLGYTVQRGIKYMGHPESLPPLRRAFWRQRGILLAAGWLLAWGGVTWALWDDLAWWTPRRWPVVVGLGVVGIAYAFLPGLSGGLRSVTWLKIPVIAAVWATATTHHPEAATDATAWAHRFLLVAALTLPFDLRDVDVDRPYMRTLPMSWGPARTLRVAQGLALASATVALWAWATRIHVAGVVRPFEAGPLVGALQSLAVVGVLRPKASLPRLTQRDEREKERWTGWVLDGMLSLPYLLLLVAHLALEAFALVVP